MYSEMDTSLPPAQEPRFQHAASFGGSCCAIMPEQPLPQMWLVGCMHPLGQTLRGPRLPQTEPGRCGFCVLLKFMFVQNWRGKRPNSPISKPAVLFTT